ncbi:MAG TPA: hypothetical protein VIQ81_03010 [Gammaproteobacteria bacterium]
MPAAFVVTLNQQNIFQASQDRLPGRVRRYLDEMDRDMDTGIMLGEQPVATPDAYQKQLYVAMQLLIAIDDHNKNQAQVLCCYLQERNPELIEVRVTEQGGEFNLKLITQ